MVALGVAFLLPGGAFASGNAVYTSTDATVKGCLNGAPDNDVNCNIYDSKDAVYLSGGPVNGGGLANGDYFFAILVPGSQPNPIDGADGNLSTSDTYADRKFNVTDGVITNLGTHANGTDKDGRDVIQAMPYDDTTNPGGVYILAVCKWLGDDPGDNDATTPSKCKYDAFKVQSGDNGGEATDPVVTKDATPSFKRTFPWSITKDVDHTLFQKLSGTVTANYTIVATKGDGVDSDWKVTGTITVFNPNTGGSVTLSDVSDDIGDPNATCTVDTSAGLVVPASDKTEYPYECDYSAAPDPNNDTNTATASWDEQDVGSDHLAANSGDGTASFAFDDGSDDNPTLVDNCATITDTLDGTETELGDACETTTYTPSATFNVPRAGCVDHNNTAAFTTDDLGLTGDDSETVRVCGPVGGEGTMGFWTNKNGQALITGGASTSGVCNSGTYLRTFNPFKDLSATATCSQVAKYVSDVIKAANASGASMNSMLKGQMLSTALDRFFNKIPNNNVDLTKINKPIGSSSYENTSAAFGGSTSLTVDQVLAYAASQSNVGGSLWYGQVKATQELAKDTFDALNNGVAFSI